MKDYSQKGFTLVELSIVMIIIGLLIGGILKGQELIANARLSSSVAKVKSIDAAINTFRDSYSALPGDADPLRLPNCDVSTMCGSAVTAGVRGDNIIGTVNQAGEQQENTSENIQAWAQLSAADLMGGVTNGVSGSNILGGETVPVSEMTGQMFIGYQNGAVRPRAYVGAIQASRAGHYLLIHDGANSTARSAQASSGSNGSAKLTPNQASRFDRKLDDGAPNSGTVLAMGMQDGSAFSCGENVTQNAYNLDTNQGVGCGLYIRIQQ